ncbi:MAG: energy-coupling factor transporter transmembrane protein EcfT [Spirochaetaceae bacterium]|jgi:energy-coupling factor transport system permease protein|nr:energy-coupling factor transporter transmembrane protein EcfT [Spirochaetaceae bacterium]
MGRFMLEYIERESPIHAVSGAVKLIVFLLWSILAMASYDTPLMIVMAALGIAAFAVSKTKINETSFIFKALILFMIFNLTAVYLFAPEHGVQVYGTRNVIWNGNGHFTLTLEELFYLFNMLLKYCMIVPAAILLIVTTHTSEFASSLNRIGVPYSIAYAVSLSLRYIPDVQKDFQHISKAQQARGVELSRKASLPARLKGSAAILLPLIFSSIDRIDTITRAMELRGFGKYKKRTWYSYRPFSRRDAVVLIAALLLFGLGMWATFRDGNRFYNPFAATV